MTTFQGDASVNRHMRPDPRAIPEASIQLTARSGKLNRFRSFGFVIALRIVPWSS